MRLEKLSLINFRNYTRRDFEFGESTILVGANAVGKTNVLEAIYVMAVGESFREGKVEEMVKWGAEVSHVSGVVNTKILRQSGSSRSARLAQDDVAGMKSLPTTSNRDNLELQVVLTRGEVQGKRVSKRRYLVNGVGRSKSKFLGNLYVVSFRPEDLRVVEGSPSRRRRFLDEVLMQVDAEYGRSLSMYNKALVRRNKILQMIREGEMTRTALSYWDQSVIKNGEYVQKLRREMAASFNNELSVIDEDLLRDLRIEYEASVMSEKRLLQYKDREVAAGHTLVGPHRDDFAIVSGNGEIPRLSGYSHRSGSAQAAGSEPRVRREGEPGMKSLPDLANSGRDLAVYGSRGEQRLAVLWLKMRAMDYVESKVEVRPVLLLDDIFSELDHEHREMVFSLFGRQQTIATTADRHYVEGFDGKVKRVFLDNDR